MAPTTTSLLQTTLSKLFSPSSRGKSSTLLILWHYLVTLPKKHNIVLHYLLKIKITKKANMPWALCFSISFFYFHWYAGSHTIGNARCTSFRQRLYNQSGNGLADFTLDQSYAAQLRTRCPRSGGDQTLFFLDFVSPTKFDNSYFKNLLASKGLLNSDEILITKSEVTKQLVQQYAENTELFFEQFAKSMVKMGNISPLTGSRGEIRKRCRKINSINQNAWFQGHKSSYVVCVFLLFQVIFFLSFPK